jgi:anaerobic ribonucleoside-triphosphate reductase
LKDETKVASSSRKKNHINYDIHIHQSTVVAGREVLQQVYKELEQKYSDG